MSPVTSRRRGSREPRVAGSGDAGIDAEPMAWLAEIPSRSIVDRTLEARFTLVPGDRSLVEAGDRVTAGDALLEHVRDRRIEEVAIPPAPPPTGDDPSASGEDPSASGPATGRRWSSAAGSRRRRRTASVEGELLAPMDGRPDRWRLITGDHRDRVESPIAGRVTAVRAGHRDRRPS